MLFSFSLYVWPERGSLYFHCLCLIPSRNTSHDRIFGVAYWTLFYELTIHEFVKRVNIELSPQFSMCFFLHSSTRNMMNFQFSTLFAVCHVCNTGWINQITLFMQLLKRMSSVNNLQGKSFKFSTTNTYNKFDRRKQFFNCCFNSVFLFVKKKLNQCPNFIKNGIVDYKLTIVIYSVRKLKKCDIEVIICALHVSTFYLINLLGAKCGLCWLTLISNKIFTYEKPLSLWKTTTKDL